MTTTLANKLTEVIFIGLPGATHHYGGLSADNFASSANQGRVSSPRDAALQVLDMARLLMSMGQTVAILPPQLRPHLGELRRYYNGDDAALIEQAARNQPALLEAVSSSSAMWVANAATVTPAIDTNDGMLRLTVANLHTNLHRRIEAMETYFTLRRIFAHIPRVIVDLPLDAEADYRDEGAANHMRLSPSHSAPGLHVFVYGTDGNPRDPHTARQNLAASQAIAQRHKLPDDAAIFVKQNPLVIEQGVFHNDVIALSNENVLLVHEDAFALGSADLAYIQESFAARTGSALRLRIIRHDELSVEEAVATYFFNSQLVTLQGGGMAIIAPSDTQDLYHGKAWDLMQSLCRDPALGITQLHAANLTQSMQNGGGPACLRLRIVLDDVQLARMHERHRVVLNESTLAALEMAVRETYPASLHASQIDAALYQRCKQSLQAIGEAIGLDLLSR